MKNFSEYLGATGVVALLAVPVLAMASAVHAEDIHIRSGDLSQPERAATFRHDLDAAADTFCSSYAITDAAYTINVCNCKAAVRDEAMSQLSPSQREQLVAAASTYSVASAR